MFGLQLGFCYEAGALVADGREAPYRENPVRDFVPCLRSGARLPHAWVMRSGRRVSVLDLVAGDQLTLITGADGDVWAQAAGATASRHVRVLVDGRDFSDVEGHWEAGREIGRGGAILVRPDQHVAWYACEPTADAATQLSSAVAAVTCQ